MVEVFIEITAEAKGIDVPGEGVEDMMVQPGIDIDIGGVAGHWVGVAGPRKRGLELGKIARDVGGLCRPRWVHHFQPGRVHIHDVAREVGVVEGLLVGVGAVDLEHVTAGNGRGIGGLRLQFHDVHAIVAALDFLLDGVEAKIVAADGRAIGDRAAAGVEEHFSKSGSGRVAAGVPAKLMDERVVQVGSVEAVLGVEHPIRLGRHAKEPNLVVLVVFIPDFQGEVVLRQTGGAAASDVEARARDERGRIGQRGAAIDRLEEHDNHALVLRRSRRREGAACQVVEEHHGQVGNERGHG